MDHQDRAGLLHKIRIMPAILQRLFHVWQFAGRNPEYPAEVYADEENGNIRKSRIYIPDVPFKAWPDRT